MGVIHADAGLPLILNAAATSEETYLDLGGIKTRGFSVRNTGTETLWLAVEKDGEWFDVAAGTSWGSRAVFGGVWHCTQLGRTTFVVNAVDVDLHEDLDRRRAHIGGMAKGG